MIVGKFNARKLALPKGEAMLLEATPDCKYMISSCNEQMDELMAQGKGVFTVTIEKWEDNRTKKQNDYMWGLLRILAEAEVHRQPTASEVENCYGDMLEEFGVGYVAFDCVRAGIPVLKKACRGWKIVDSYFLDDGTEIVKIFCFNGSSGFNKEQMSIFIDSIKDRLYQMSLPKNLYDRLLYYEGLLEELYNGKKKDAE